MSKIPHPNAGPSYEISKSALVALSRHIAFNYAKYNIRSNIISPGTIKSKMQSTMKKNILLNIKKIIPLQRFGKPVEIAKLVKFLLSNESSYITGADIKISGGSILD
jgi:3-oxoacyl-[acyl-carrier protein] reductase